MMKWIKKSLFLRLLISYMITIVIGLGTIGILISFLAKGYIYDSKKEELLRKAKKVNLSIQNEQEINETTLKVITLLDQTLDSKIWVFDRTGTIIATSSKDEVTIGKSVNQKIVTKVLQGENVTRSLVFEGLTESAISVVIPWGKEKELYGGIVLHASASEMKETLGHIRETILWVSLIGLIFSLSLVTYLSWSISRPLQIINRTTTQIGLGNYHERVQIEAIDEIGDLAHSVNTLAQKLETLDRERSKLDQIRNDFLANVSHELRTPLTAMQGFLEALQDGFIPEEGRGKYYEVMYRETKHMNRLIDDIMDLIMLENDEITLSEYPVDLKGIINKVVFKLTQECIDKGNIIKVDVRDNLPKVYGDEVRLEQILTNLINNSIKFTENGLITIKANREGAYLRIEVCDTGVGISKNDLDLIWERFFKVDRHRSMKDKGTGLGLSIVKELVELHQGKIEVDSVLGQGTTFTLWIPSVNQ